MKRIIKDEVPLFLSRYVKRHPNESYDRLDETDEGRNVRNEIRKHMLINQKYICCYCCKSVDDYNSHNEHIKPRAKFPKLSMNYNNLLASCKGKTCGEKKIVYTMRYYLFLRLVKIAKLTLDICKTVKLKV